MTNLGLVWLGWVGEGRVGAELYRMKIEIPSGRSEMSNIL